MHDRFTIHTIAVLIVGGMLLVSLGRGRLLGSAARVHESQFGHVFEIVRRVRAALADAGARDLSAQRSVRAAQRRRARRSVSARHLLVLGSIFSPTTNCAFSSVAKLAHMKAGHTRMTSLISINGREHPIIAGVFRRVVCARSTSPRTASACSCATRSTSHSRPLRSRRSTRSAGRSICVRSPNSGGEIDAEPLMRMGERLGSTPFATNRIARLYEFAQDPFVPRVVAAAQRRRAKRAPPVPGRAVASFAGAWRRSLTIFFDLMLNRRTVCPGRGGDDSPATTTNALSPKITITDAQGRTTTKNIGDLSDSEVAELTKSGIPEPLKWFFLALFVHHESGKSNAAFSLRAVLPLYLIYSIIFVGLIGQTFGMMILDVRIVDVQFPADRVRPRDHPVSITGGTNSSRSSAGFFVLRRVQPFEAWSGTRTVNGKRARVYAGVDAGSDVTIDDAIASPAEGPHTRA